MLRNSPILILDEFTSAADNESQAEVYRALKSFKRGRTVLLITHRLSALEIVDRIAVMEQGRVVAIGTHAELLANCPAFQRLHDSEGQRRCA